jgi:8-oxo-dGTP pyrophosphatase MutT (NUDIX family)
MTITHDQAYGLIPIFTPPRQDRRYLLILHQKGHWALPKGHKELGETDLETACREVREETGLEDYTVLEEKKFTEQYQFQPSPGETIVKTVTYFVAQVSPTATGDCPKITVQQAEVADYRWCTFTEAIELSTFAANRQVLQDCEAYLQSHG